MRLHERACACTPGDQSAATESAAVPAWLAGAAAHRRRVRRAAPRRRLAGVQSVAHTWGAKVL